MLHHAGGCSEEEKHPTGYLISDEAWEKYVAKHPEFKGRKKPTGGLEGTFAIAGVLGGLFFLSPNLTGNAIANVNIQNSSILGASLLIVGLVAGFFLLKSKSK